MSVAFITPGGTANALSNITISVNRGEILAIVGESGSGKSVTSLSVLQLLPSPPAVYTSGRILFNNNGQNHSLLQLPEEELASLRGQKIAMIFQEPMTSLNPVLTCGFQVAEAIRCHNRLSAAAARQQTLALFERVQLPDPVLLFDRYPHQLSGGQKQRVMIAMAMSCEPSLLICDEPTTALDVTVQKNILQLIKELQQQNDMGVIFITHDLSVVAEIADRVAVMYKGAIVEQAATDSLFRSPQHPYTKALLACRPALHTRGERLPVVADFMETDADGSTSEKNASVHPQKIHDGATRSADTLLAVTDLKVSFPATRNWLGNPKTYIHAVDGVSFTVREGETLGLVGESGCGKSTLGRAILRLTEPTAGKLEYRGKDLLRCSAREMQLLRKDMQVVFQDPYASLNPRISIGDAIAEPLLVHRIAHTAKARKEKTIELLEKVGLAAAHYHRYPHEFSGGQRQRIVIARALALEPSFVVCDESVSALDVSVQAQVLNLLNDLKKEFGFTAIFISHDLSVVRYISDRIMVMNRGRIEEIGEAEELYRNPKTAYTRRLIDSIPRMAV
ncbi:ABC transporter ATP-binding protein [Sediminibacterium soli]|uniref:ABC transporter ATP-binding protein n=1 Tax=Sediminibacterium soli TaxID=2698829 RepID=UPI001F409DAF|nr:ABC transporter ATP-binding protein [Sediminibacterium soli]